MTGKCITKTSKIRYQYRLTTEESIVKLYVFDGQWMLIGNQIDFEREYEFLDQVNAAIVLNYIANWYYLLSPMKYRKFQRKVNSTTVTVKNIAHFLCGGEPQKIRVLNIMGIHTVNQVTQKISEPWFVFRNEYQGIHFANSHYIMIGENTNSPEMISCFINGKIIHVFLENWTDSEKFTSFFILMNPDETKEDAWKRYENELHIKQFDL